MPARRSLADKERYFKLRAKGANNREACKMIGINENTGTAWWMGAKDSSGRRFKEKQMLDRMTKPKDYADMRPEAQKGHDDFEFFRRAHFGRVSSPWQVDAGYKFLECLASPRKEYINLNCPPGGGKSTLLHDIEAWMTVRKRSIRGLVGSSNQRLANRYNARLKRSFERPKPAPVDDSLVKAGLAVQPLASLSEWYGRFQPDQQDLWRMEEFIVAQIGDTQIGEKEPTWQAFGLETEFLGNRVDLSVWDDVVTQKLLRTAEAIEKQRTLWDNEAENRIEPAGALFIVGQRLSPHDLYAYNKAKLMDEDLLDYENLPDDDDFPDNYFEIEPEGSDKPRMYTSVVYPAHDEFKCKGLHSDKKDELRFWAPDDPDACLLDPIRLSWRELRQKQLRSTENYRVVYQQEDVDPSNVLVPRAFVSGGMYEGEELPGCYDEERKYHQIPKSLSADTYSVVTMDPSVKEYWGIQWWLYDASSEMRYLMDLYRQRYDVDQILDYNPDSEPKFFGLLEDLWQISSKLGRPFKYLIIEQNGAQRFFMKFDFFKRWCAMRGVSYFPHDTNTNKADPDFGVQILRTQYRHGRVRLPNSHERGDYGFAITKQLVDEVTVWPNGHTSDQVMAQWFLEWWIPRIVTPFMEDIPMLKRQSWLGGNRRTLQGV